MVINTQGTSNFARGMVINTQDTYYSTGGMIIEAYDSNKYIWEMAINI